MDISPSSTFILSWRCSIVRTARSSVPLWMSPHPYQLKPYGDNLVFLDTLRVVTRTCEHQEKRRKEGPQFVLYLEKSHQMNCFQFQLLWQCYQSFEVVMFFKYFILFIISVNVCDVLEGTHVEVTRKLCGVDSHLLHFCGFWGLNSGGQTCTVRQEVPLATELSSWPKFWTNIF